MGAPKVSEAQFVDAWHRHGSPQKVADEIGIHVRQVYSRRDRLAKRGIILNSIQTGHAPATWGQEFPTAYVRERRIELVNCSIIVGSDAHIWPGENTAAMRGLLAAIPIVKPAAIFANGDWIDGARISRHGRIGWAKTPTVAQELEAVKAFMDDVVHAAAKADRDCTFHFNVGNHDSRFDNYLSKQAPEFEGMPLMRMEDHFPRWQFQWSTFVNATGPHPVMIKHRFASAGIHAGYNATLRAGLTTVSGHTHILETKTWGDYRGRRWGIQTGTLADLNGPQFEYGENNPSSACSGFVVLTFVDGHLMPPETCEVINGRAYFRGQCIA